MKINTRQLIGGLRAVCWGLPGSRTPQPRWVPWPEPRQGRVGLSLCCLGVGQPFSLGFPHRDSRQEALGRPGPLSKPPDWL